MQLESGTRLGEYEIVGVVGAGGMGEVYFVAANIVFTPDGHTYAYSIYTNNCDLYLLDGVR